MNSRATALAPLILTLSLGVLIPPGGFAQQKSEDTFQRWSAFYRTIRSEIRSDDYRKQLAAVEKFAGQDYPEAAAYLIELIERRKPSALVARKAAEVLGSYRNEQARETIAEKVRKDPAGSRYLLLAFVAQDFQDSPAVALEALRKARSPATLTVALEAIGKHPDQELEIVAELIARLSPENYHTARKAAADSLGRVRSGASVLPLIELLDDKLLAAAARDALLRLTGEAHWTDENAWRTWWASHATTFEPAPMGDAEFEKAHAALLAKNGDGTGDGMMAEFYGKKLQGKNILFLLDASGSMKVEERMDRLKGELRLMIGQMEETYRFGLIMFPHDTFPARGIEPASPRMKDRAERFIDRIDPNGGTPMAEALRFAFEKIVPKENVDTIYLLSDGEPSDALPDRLQDVILEFNEPLGVAIHTIWVGGEGRDLLLQIAAQNWGQFWEAP